MILTKTVYGINFMYGELKSRNFNRVEFDTFKKYCKIGKMA